MHGAVASFDGWVTLSEAAPVAHWLRQSFEALAVQLAHKQRPQAQADAVLAAAFALFGALLVVSGIVEGCPAPRPAAPGF